MKKPFGLHHPDLGIFIPGKGETTTVDIKDTHAYLLIEDPRIVIVESGAKLPPAAEVEKPKATPTLQQKVQVEPPKKPRGRPPKKK